MRGREPDRTGFAVRDGVRISYEIFGDGPQTVVLFPAWSIAHSRIWKAQVPYLSRFARVIAFDGRGNGKSDKSPDLDYSDDAYALDALAVLDATSTARASVVALSAGARWALMVAAQHPERVERLLCIAPAVPLAEPTPARAAALSRFESALPSHDGWNKLNRRYWERGGYRDFLEFFWAECFPEPHSTKQIEDGIGWGLGTTPETLAATVVAPSLTPQETALLAAAVRCPVLVLHGRRDRIVPFARGKALADATNATLIPLDGSGHLPQARIPIAVNLLLRDVLQPARTASPHKLTRKKRVLFLSSPIGLGHAQRDLAIARELRAREPETEISWLSQHPVTAVLAAAGETIHPASGALVNESAHFESECVEHDLHAFEAIRRMDEIMVANFMTFYELLGTEKFDLVVGDESWDVDYFLHEHPERKKAAFVWLTDFVGWLPIPDGGEREARLTRDYNLEMIEHIDRSPRLRDRALFVGEPQDIVPERFAPDLPLIREWTAAHYDFAGYVTGFSPPSAAERAAWRHDFGYRDDELIGMVTVGGSGAGRHLLRRIMAAFPEAKRRVPALRMIVVAGPRIDAASLSASGEIEVRAFVPNLYRHLAACDVALVQGGLTTTMELTAARRPFIFFPLKHHFEQNFHVRHRLARYRAGRPMDYDAATPEAIASAIEEELRRSIDYVAVASDGAEKAAALIGEML
jgi:pimeloyl-ACP methyl ester carboxylesterase/predicted glycosyltransferase